MTPKRPNEHSVVQQLKWPLRLTRFGLTAERALRAFWPLISIILACLGALMLGLQDLLPFEFAWGLIIAVCLAGTGFLIAGLRKFVMPRKIDALARLDASLPGRPIQALMDGQAIGPGDPASVALWDAHQARMADRAASAKAPKPDLQLASRDPYALRYVALLFFAVAILFGSIWRVGSVNQLAAGTGTAVGGPVWEGWIEPPSYTGLPSLYLADQGDALRVPEGSLITVRLYGAVGALTVSETISNRTENTGSAADPVQSFDARVSGTVEIAGPGGRSWAMTVQQDTPPSVQLQGEPERAPDGGMTQAFTAQDDYGVTGGTVRIALDLDRIDRRYGLAVDPEQRAAIVLDMPLPISGDRTGFQEAVLGNFSEHPFANLPVTFEIMAEDASEQTGSTGAAQLRLPARKFFDPLAAAIVEQRQSLLWSKANAPLVAQLLRAISHRPEDIFRSDTVYLRLRVLLRRLETQSAYGGFDEAARDEIVAALWDLALLIEDGDVEDALERMRRAQERLSEAMKNGASDQEIAELMEELRRANENYLQQLQRQAQQDGDQPQGSQDNAMQLTQDDLQDMMDRIQDLMKEGRMAEAQQALDELQQMIEDMQVAEGGEGQPSDGEQAMEDLSDTLREQQGLSDQAFRDLQEQFNPNAQQGQSNGNEGRNGGQGRGQSHEGQGGEGSGDGSEQGQSGEGGDDGAAGLADRQEALRREVERQRQNLPGAGSAGGDAARDALRRAEDAMRGAGDALQNDDLAGAIDQQSEAMEALRDGIRDLGEALAENEQQQGQQGTAEGQAGGAQRDPLGRSAGNSGQAGTDDGLLQGEDVYRRARDLLDEIRKRSGEGARPEIERNYLKRLLDLF